MYLTFLRHYERSWFISQLFSYAYPLYSETKIVNYEHYFNGTGFFIEAEGRYFFVFTRHQYENVKDQTIWVPFSSGSEVLLIDQGKMCGYENSDVVISEVELTEKVRNSIHPLEIARLIKPYVDDAEYSVIGYQQSRNANHYDNRDDGVLMLEPKVGGVITREVDWQSGDNPIKLGLEHVELNVIEKITTWDELTQGFSGAPVFAIRTKENTENRCVIDLKLIGMAVYASSNPPEIGVTHSGEILLPLLRDFNVKVNGLGIEDLQNYVAGTNQ